MRQGEHGSMQLVFTGDSKRLSLWDLRLDTSGEARAAHSVEVGGGVRVRASPRRWPCHAPRLVVAAPRIDSPVSE